MNILSGIYEITKESILHPLSGSQLVESGSGYVAIRPGADLSHKKFENYDFSGMDFKYVNLDATEFVNCNLDGADFTGAKNIHTAKFVGTPTQNASGLPSAQTTA